ncbi:MAG: helix-turn-helix transcriptional regulator [Bdellovibrionaceae bacterium]|nr:helix-turn-helix transcriptional regulator [Pseudobdellovibrionaceae bacterium]
MSKKNVYIEIGQMVRNYREKNGMTQLELAEKLGYQTSQFVSLFERGLSKVPMEVLGQLVIILGIPEKQFKNVLVKDFESEINARINFGKKTAAKAI